MIKRCFLYKATQRRSVARSSEKRCREERELERKSGQEPRREPERRSKSLMRTGDRNRSCEPGVGITKVNGDGIGNRIEDRETGNGK